LRFKQRDLIFRGHAIECRINAEDPFTFVSFSRQDHVLSSAWRPRHPSRFAHLPRLYVRQHYDSMVAKVIAYGDTRDQAIRRMRIALSEMSIEGIKTNIALHQELMYDAGFMKGA